MTNLGYFLKNSPVSGFQTLVTLTLTLDGSGHTAYRPAAVIDLYSYIPNVIKIGKTFLWTEYPQEPLEVQGHVTQKLEQNKNPAQANLETMV